MNTKITFAISCLVFSISVSTYAQSPAASPTAVVPTAAAPTASAPTADSWPRVFNTDGFTVTVYPPAITTWDTRTLSGTSAFSRTVGWFCSDIRNVFVHRIHGSQSSESDGDADKPHDYRGFSAG